MKLLLYTLLFALCTLTVRAQSVADVRIVFIRHGEKPAEGDHLSCAGYNRSVSLPGVLVKKFGIPQVIFVPSISNGKSTKSVRMMETAAPLAIKYNLAVNSKFDVKDKEGLASSLLQQSGLILVVWEHKALPGIIKHLGIREIPADWPENDFDSIWIVTVHQGKATLTKDKESIRPASGCSF